MDAPKPIFLNDILKKYSLTSNKSKKYQINFIIKEKDNLYLQAQEEESLTQKCFQGIFSLQTIKENQFFYIYNSINEILDELFPLIENGKAELKEENNLLILVINLPIKKVKEISFKLKESEKRDKDKIEELYQIVSSLQKENCNLNKKIERLEKRVDDLEKENKKLKGPLEKEKNKFEKFQGLNSSIIKTQDNFDFIVKILKENIINKNIIFKLLYRASTDGDDSNIFHQKCDNHVQILAIFKTTKGFTFGGYTEIGYKGSYKEIIDNKAFFFSCDRKKVYKVKYNKTAILDGPNYGPIFGNNTTIIYVQNKMLSYNCCTTTINSSTFDGLESDYEITNGESRFYLEDVEVFKILFE